MKKKKKKLESHYKNIKIYPHICTTKTFKNVR